MERSKESDCGGVLKMIQRCFQNVRYETGKDKWQDGTGDGMAEIFVSLMMDLLLALFMISFSSQPRTGNGYLYDDTGI